MTGSFKKMVSAVVVGSACMLTVTGNVLAEEEKPTADFTVSALSQYIWRGFAFSKDSVVIQPSTTVGYKGFAANLWGNLDTDVWNSTGEDANNWTETDLTLSYDYAMGPVALSGGYIYYALDAATDSQEIYLSAGLDTLLSPTLTIYRDIDHYAGWYITLDVSHSFQISGDITLDLGAKVSYLSADEASSYADPDDPTQEYSDFNDGVLSAALTVPVNEYISVSPQLYYSFALSSDADDMLKAANMAVIDKNKSDFLYGGVAVSFAF